MFTMKIVFVVLIATLTGSTRLAAQAATGNKAEILRLIDRYSESVIKRDSIAFYELFNNDVVSWCAAIKEKSHAREMEGKDKETIRDSYFSSNYRQFMRGLFRYGSTEDKFDNIRIHEDGTVASVLMDYSFWVDNKMTNWGSKYLSLIKRGGRWKITGVIYSLELTTWYQQPPLQERLGK